MNTAPSKRLATTSASAANLANATARVAPKKPVPADAQANRTATNAGATTAAIIQRLHSEKSIATQAPRADWADADSRQTTQHSSALSTPSDHIATAITNNSI